MADLKKSWATAKAVVSAVKAEIGALESARLQAAKAGNGPAVLAALAASQDAEDRLQWAESAEAEAYRTMRAEEATQLAARSRKATGRLVASARPQRGGVDVGARLRTEQKAMWPTAAKA